MKELKGLYKEKRNPMKIIKEGNKELLKKTKRFNCDKCGCVFEADKGEYKCYTQYNTDKYYCVCPCCKNDAYEERTR